MPEGPDGKTIIIVKKVSGHGGHHGGAWKVAYADFVTAMMALFMVLWLVNSASVTTREKIASFFRRPGVFEKGSGTPLETGGSGILPDAFSPPSEGNASIAPSENTYSVGQSGGEYLDGFGRGKGERSGEEGDMKEEKQGLTFEMIAANIKASINDAVLKEGGFGDDYYGQALGNGQLLGDKKADPTDIVTVTGHIVEEERKELEAGKEGILSMKKQTGAGAGESQAEGKGEVGSEQVPATLNPLGEIDVVIDQRGIHIEIMDTEKTSMFEVGSAGIRGDAEKALDKIAQMLIKVPNPIDIEGHTDALPFSA